MKNGKLHIYIYIIYKLLLLSLHVYERIYIYIIIIMLCMYLEREGEMYIYANFGIVLQGAIFVVNRSPFGPIWTMGWVLSLLSSRTLHDVAAEIH